MFRVGVWDRSGHFPPTGQTDLLDFHHFCLKMSTRKSKKSQILEQQSNKRQIINEIAGIVQQLRAKPDWIEKISNLSVRERYVQEAIDQGLSHDNIQKAFSILETMALCQPPRVDALRSDIEADELEVIVQVGETNFVTTTRILTADTECMLNRMFSPPWFQPLNDDPITIETPSNSALIFTYILNYLTLLKNNETNICPDISSLTPEELETLKGDCDYLGTRQLGIAIDVMTKSQEMFIAGEQQRTSRHLSQVSRKLSSAREEKIRLEKRLAELPKIIAELEQEEEEAQRLRLLPVTRWVAKPGEKILLNTSNESWSEYTLEEVHGALRAKSTKRNYGGAEKSIPLPGPAFYHPVSSTPKCSCDALYYDNYLPETLARSVEDHLDALLHEKPLDLHPGSDGQVVDLIHPSLFPYIKGLSPISDNDEFSKCVPIDGEYSWLPSDFHIDESGGVVIGSYINNLDQNKYPHLYFDIAQIFQTILPIFESKLGKKFRSCTLQVIVKAAYYFIPPGEVYEGSWHVEGLPHENIYANAIYYISSSENIENNYLEFRHLQSEENFYEINGRAGEEVELVEDLGSIDTPTGRIIVWKNELQHKVGPLSVSNTEKKKKSKSSKTDVSHTLSSSAGIRKILCFFLVSPERRVVSTKIVPPQQNIIPLEVALEHRQKLMNERKYFAKQDAEDWETRTYTFCEH